MSTKFQFALPTTFLDGSPLAASDLAAMKYQILVDTANPPNLNDGTCKVFDVPAANVAAANAGVVTVLFSELGFVPAANVTYFAAAQDEEGTAVSPESNVVTFTNVVAPSAPGNFTVA